MIFELSLGKGRAGCAALLLWLHLRSQLGTVCLAFKIKGLRDDFQEIVTMGGRIVVLGTCPASCISVHTCAEEVQFL